MHDTSQTIEQIVRRIPPPQTVEAAPAAPQSGNALTAAVVPSPVKLLQLPKLESRSKRFGFALLAILICALLFGYTSSFWAPAHEGNNQNGYLVGGKLLATTGTTGFEPKSPLSFVGWMWVMADADSKAPGGGMVYPKYPLGVPALVALVYKVAGPEHGVEWVYRISPIAMTLAVLGMFFLARPLMGSFAAIMAMILLAGGQVGLVLTNNPNSHASAMFFLMWGMVLLLYWWRTDRWWIGAIAGFMLGYAVTIRYTEGLLLGCIAVPVLCLLPYQRRAEVRWWVIAVWIASLAAAAVMLFVYAQQQTYLLFAPATVALVIALTGAFQHYRSDGAARDLILDVLRAIACAAIVSSCIYFARSQSRLEYPNNILPIVGAVLGALGTVFLLYAIRWHDVKRWTRALSPLIGWAIPVAVLLVFNLLTVHSLTGYDSTNESTGFTWDKFEEKWNYAVGQLYWTGLYFVLPLAVAGLVTAFRWNWRVAVLLCAWAIPGTLLYMAYYYGMNMPLIGYLRFFTTVLPPAFLAAAWMLREASLPGSEGVANARNYKSVAGPIAMGIFVAIVTVANMKSLSPSMERDQVVAANLANAGSRIRAAAPAGSVVFGQSQRLLNYLQFAGDYDLYGADYIDSGSALPPARSGGDADPTPFQKARRDYVARAYKELDRPAMVREVTKICSDSLSGNHRVFVILGSNAPSWCKIFIDPKKFETRVVEEWTDPVRMSAAASRTLAAIGTMARSGSGRWMIMEVLPKSIESAPATHPSTRPSDSVAMETNADRL